MKRKQVLSSTKNLTPQHPRPPPPHPTISKLIGSLDLSCVQKIGGGRKSRQPVFHLNLVMLKMYTSLINGILVGSFHMFCLIEK